MFVIADDTKKFPVFLREVLNSGWATVTMSMAETQLFKTRVEANAVFTTIKDSGQFQFKVHQLEIKQ